MRISEPGWYRLHDLIWKNILTKTRPTRLTKHARDPWKMYSGIRRIADVSLYYQINEQQCFGLQIQRNVNNSQNETFSIGFHGKNTIHTRCWILQFLHRPRLNIELQFQSRNTNQNMQNLFQMMAKNRLATKRKLDLDSVNLAAISGRTKSFVLW